MTLNEFHKRCTMHGGDWTSMYMSGIAEVDPELYKSLPELEYSFESLSFVVRHLCTDTVHLRYYKGLEPYILEWKDGRVIAHTKPSADLCRQVETYLYLHLWMRESQDPEVKQVLELATEVVDDPYVLVPLLESIVDKLPEVRRFMREVSYMYTDILPYAGVVEFEDFQRHYEEVCEEFAASPYEYLYVHRNHKQSLLHFTAKSNVANIKKLGLLPGSAMCDVGSAVYAYDIQTPADSVFPIACSFHDMQSDSCVVKFTVDDYYQCVYCKDTNGPIRYCVVPHAIPVEQIEGIADSPAEFLESLDTLAYLSKMGYPAFEVEACRGMDLADACRKLNG